MRATLVCALSLAAAPAGAQVPNHQHYEKSGDKAER